MVFAWLLFVLTISKFSKYKSFIERLNWAFDVDPKLVPPKENTEHGLEVRKIY